MAEDEVKAALKAYFDCKDCAGAENREAANANFNDFLAGKPDLPAPLVKTAVQLVATTVHIYGERRSQAAAEQVVATLLRVHGPTALKALVSACSSLTSALKSTAQPTLSTVAVFRWVCLLLGSSHVALASDDWTALLVLASQLLAVLVQDPRKNLPLAMLAWLHLCKHREGASAAIAETVARGERPEDSLLMAALAHAAGVPADHRDAFIDVAAKSLFSSKTGWTKEYLTFFHPLFAATSHEVAKDKLVPTMQRSLKRQPETMLDVVGGVLAGVQLDLSRYYAVFGETLLPFLAGSDALRASTLNCYSALLARCSDGPALELAAASLVDGLQGKGVKLTTTEQRTAALTAILSVLHAPVSDAARSALAAKIADLLLPLATKEVLELVQAELYVSISKCAAFLSANSPPAATLLAHVKAVVDDAKAKHSSLLGALRVAHALYRDDGPLPLTDSLVKLLDRMPAVTTHPSVASESVLAVHLLFKAATLDEALKTRLRAAKWWAGALDGSLFGDKLATTASDDLCVIFTHLTASVLFIWTDLVLSPAQLSKWCAHYASMLLHSSSTVRSQAASRLKGSPLQAREGSVPVAILSALFEQFTAVPAAEQYHSRYIGALTAVAAAGLAPLGVTAAAALVLPAHHRVVATSKSALPRLWRLAGFPFTASLNAFADVVGNVLAQTVSAGPSASPDRFAAAQTAITQLAALEDADCLRAWLADWAGARLSDHAIDAITQQDCAIWRWKEGVPYNEAAEAETLERNSKDYADKKWELEVRRELAAKKGGKVEPAVKLTKKQEEILKAQLQRESAIRAEVTRLDALVQAACTLIESLLRGAGTLLGPLLPALAAHLLFRLRSPLVASRAMRLYVSLSSATTISPTSLAEAVARVAVRVAKPAIDVPAAWSAEKLDTMIARVMRSIWTATNAKPYSPPDFAFCLAMVDHILRSTTLPIAVLEDALTFANNHVHLAGSPFVPHDKLLNLLVGVIGTHPRLAHQASILFGDYCRHLREFFRLCPAGSGLSSRDAILHVVLSSIHNPHGELRLSAIRSVVHVPLPDAPSAWQLGSLHLACFDSVTENANAAKVFWASKGFALPPDAIDVLIDVLMSKHEEVRAMASRALAAALQAAPAFVDSALTSMITRYHMLLAEPEPLRDSFGNLIPTPPPDPWEGRCGLSDALANLAPLFSADQVSTLISLYVESALADRNEKARAAALAASTAIVDAHGKAQIGTLLPILENRLATIPKADGRLDVIRQSAIVLLGTLAKHLEKTDPKIPAIIQTLVATLWTPSQAVQEAVASCLAPLAPAIKDTAGELISSLMKSLLESESYGTRRGAAYGLAGVVKGLSILALKQHGIMDQLLEAVQNKKHARQREGALMAFELLCSFLGRLFEPYVIHVLPHLLLCYGDSSNDVRAAAQDTARMIMSKLTAHGVKLVLPALLDGLGEDSWRTKTGSIELLGAMANCSPKQLSMCLPSIVPRLIAVLTDTHQKVQQAGRDAISQITQVIKNPEILHIAPAVLAALSEPTTKTQACLDALLQTAFVHVIDAPSLAIIMPVLQRALNDRASEIKMRAAQIIGNLYTLTDPKDLTPYISEIMPSIQASLVDPLPEVRSVSAKALGAMFKGMGEENCGHLIPWLIQLMRSKTGTVDRAGAAQGLSEVLFTLGTERLATHMDMFVEGTSDPLAYVREGHFLLFVYLPATFGEQFGAFVARVVPCVLHGLADIEETVRDSATRVGQRIISHFSDQSVALLLPELELGMEQEDWRIRQSSIHLLGDLFYKISGLSGNKTTDGDEDDNFGTEEGLQALLVSLGRERRNRILARLYVARSDMQLPVRQASMHVWKVVVHHTVRTLREIMPVLITLLLGFLASPKGHLRIPAARTLGELVRKLGERVLPDIIPILERGMAAADVSHRQGVCFALVEIIDSGNKEVVAQFLTSLVPSVRRALSDPSPLVREAAANAFSAMHNCMGPQVVDDVLPQLMASLGNAGEDAEAVLDGLRLIMAAKSKVLVPFLVPRLLKTPITAVNAKALASLTALAGPTLGKYLVNILHTLLEEGAKGGETLGDIRAAAQALVLTVDETSFGELLTELLAACDHTNPARRLFAIQLLSTFCQDSPHDYGAYIPSLLRGYLKIFGDRNTEVLATAWAGVSAVLAKVSAEDKLAVLRALYQGLRHVLSDRKDDPLPGFSLPRGLEPFISLFNESLGLSGLEAKETAAEGLGLLAQLTRAEDLEAYSLKITGPLIRASSESQHQVRAAALASLITLLEKIPNKLKAFVPQLQPTCVKALKEPTKIVRDRATQALTHIIMLLKDKKIDPLLTELTNSAKTAEGSIRATLFQSLQAALHHAGSTATDAVKRSVQEVLVAALGSTEEPIRVAGATALASLANLGSDEALLTLLRAHVLVATPAGPQAWITDHGKACCLDNFAWLYGPRLLRLGTAVFQADLARWVRYDNTLVSGSGASAAAGVLLWASKEDAVAVVDAVAPLIAAQLGASDVTHDGIIAVLNSLVRLGREAAALHSRVYALLLPPLFNIIRQKSGPVKKATDRALVYLLQLRRGNAGFDAAVAALGPDTIVDLPGYHRKVLAARAAEQSDDESES